MRRAACCVLVCAAATASAGPTEVTAEGGAEADTNVNRVEVGDRVAAPVARFGAKLAHRARLWHGAYSASGSALTRLVLLDPGSDAGSKAQREDQVLLTGDLRWLRPLGTRPVAAGLSLSAVDALPMAGAEAARKFRTLGADGLLVLRASDDRALSLAVGWRDFRYKPEDTPTSNHDLDWMGPIATARLDLTLWQDPGGTRSLEVAFIAGFEARAYEGLANASSCPEGAPAGPECFTPTAYLRRDRFQRAGAELMWSGGVIAAVGYQLSTIDSNSYGQSLIRHRVTVSATTNLMWGLVGTALGTLQIDKYLDGILRETDPQHAIFSTLDDENRSSLQLRLARQVSRSWALEGRGAIWRNIGGNRDLTFRRTVAYFGAVFAR